MKSLKYILILLGVLSLTSCEDYFGENANVDPDSPTTATVGVLLPQVQARLAYTWGGDFTRYLSVNTQHADGVGRQFAVIGQYGIVPADVNSAWSNVYSGCMNSNIAMRNQAIESGAKHVEAVSYILEAFTMMMATDVWGDLPYSDAFKFGENGVYTPAFDAQQNVYAAVIGNLDNAIALLQGDDGGVGIPGDLYYGSDSAKWLAAANAIAARASLHLSKVDGEAHSKAMNYLPNAFTSIADEFGMAFGSAASENAPWFQYIEQRDDMEVGANYVALLESLSDPRIATYGFEHSGDNPVFVPDQFVKMLSYTEVLFMRAEAMLETGNAEGAHGAFIAAIRNSMLEAGLGLDEETVDEPLNAYLAGVDPGAGALSLEDIITQKYIALYTSPEVFNDWRRTGIPSLSPVTGTEIPRRFPYPENEQLSNPNTPSPANVTIFSRIWWDN